MTIGEDKALFEEELERSQQRAVVGKYTPSDEYFASEDYNAIVGGGPPCPTTEDGVQQWIKNLWWQQREDEAYIRTLVDRLKAVEEITEALGL